MGGPDMAPQPPRRSDRPGEAVAVLYPVTYTVTVGDGRSTEALVEAGTYGYAHSAVLSENFPARHAGGPRVRELVLLRFAGEVTAPEVQAEAAWRGLQAPTYEDALYFGIAHPEAQREGPIVFMHEPWVGYFGRRDVLCLWDNAGRRELGLDGFDDTWREGCRFAFVTPAAGGG